MSIVKDLLRSESPGKNGAFFLLMRNSPDVVFLDGIAGSMSAIAVFAFQNQILALHGWSSGFVSFHVIASLCYGVFALTLAFRRIRPLRLIQTLAVANIVWAVLCGSLAIFWLSSLTIFGVLHLLLEMIFVGGLGLYELRVQLRLIERGSAN